MTDARPRGRPAGATNITDIVPAEPSRCTVCGSTDREAYSNYTDLEQHGVTSAGKPFTHIVWRSTRCRACGQARRDITHENRV